MSRGFWLTAHLPEVLEMDRPLFLTVYDLERALGPVTVQNLAIPHDCTDGFLGAYWRQPVAHLDERVRVANSTFSKLSEIEPVLNQLSTDLDSGTCRRTYADLFTKTKLDLGYRLLVAGA